MSDEGGTSVGSIKGLLELDISDYMSKIGEAKDAETDLKSEGDHDIRIGADIHDAMDKMDEVAGKADRTDSQAPDIHVQATISDAMRDMDEVDAKARETSDEDATLPVHADIHDAMDRMDEVAGRRRQLTSEGATLNVDAKVDEAMNRIDAVATAAQAVDAKPVSIQVNADTGMAVTRIAAVAEAEADLSMSTDRLKAGYEALDAVESEGTTSQSALMVQEAAVSRLEDEHAAAQERLNDTLSQYNVRLMDASMAMDMASAQAAQLEARKIDLRVDAKIDEAMARINEVAAQAQMLEGRTVHIQVDARTGRAVAQLGDVSQAELALEAATARLHAAYGQLDDVQSRDVASQSALMTAEVTATRVEQDQATAREHLNALLEQHGVQLGEDTVDVDANGVQVERQAQSMTGAATAVGTATDALRADSQANREDSDARDADSQSTDRQSHSYHELRNSLLMAAPALIPIAGAAAGAGVALIAMGAAGVMAVKGISMAMHDGSVTGQQYSADVRSLAKDLTQLERTGAVGFLSGMNTMTREIGSQMPYLATMTATYSRDLGTISGNTVAGVLGLFRQLQPVTIEVADGLTRASGSFRDWGSGSGAKEFVTYLLQQLPIVSSALGSLGSAVGHVIQAFSPIGDLVLETITGLSNAISAIPTPMLTTLAAAALGAYAAFKVFGTVKSIIGGVQTALDGLGKGESFASMLTPIGGVTVALGLLGAAYSLIASKSQTAAKDQETYSAALQESNGVIDDSVAKSVAKQAQDDGALDLSSKLGVSTGELTDAVISQGDSYDLLKGKLEKAVAAGTTWNNTQYGGFKTQTAQAQQAQKLLGILDTEHGKFAQSQSDQAQVAQATQDTTRTLDNQALILGISEDKWLALSAAEASASSAAKDYKSALDALNGQAQTLDQATDALTVQFDTMASSIKQNISQVGRAQATSMDNSTTYGAKNHQLIEQTVQDAQAKADAIVNSEGKSEKSYTDARNSLEQSRQKILQVAQANGLNTQQVSAYLDQIMKIPPEDTTRIILDDSQATAGLKNLGVKTATLTKDDKHVTITGDNTKAMKAIADVTGAPIDPKTGQLTLDKMQYDVALALANGAPIDPKTGLLLGNNSPMFQKLMQANGWTIDPKTGAIRGDNGQYLSARNVVQALKIGDKSGLMKAIDEVTAVINAINNEQLQNKSVDIVTNFISNHIEKHSGPEFGVSVPGGMHGGGFDGTRFLPGFSSGGVFSGMVPGPSSPVDNVLLGNARLRSGEHVLTVDDVRAMGGQRGVYAFRAALHDPRSNPNPTPAFTGSTGGVPSRITLVDADGSILARVRAIVEDSAGRHRTNLVRGLLNG